MVRASSYYRRNRNRRPVRRRVIYKVRGRRRRRVPRRRALAVRRPNTFLNQFAYNKAFVKLFYNDVISLNPTTNSVGANGSNVWAYQANNIYDPDNTSTGHQPMYADNYALVYSRYQVMYATIKVTVVNHFVNTKDGGTEVPNYSYRLFITRDCQASSDKPGGTNELLEEKGTNIRWRFVGPSLNGKLPQLGFSVVPHKLQGLNPRDDSMQASTGGGPDKGAYFLIYITSADGATDPPSVYLNVQLCFHVMFYDRILNQAQN